VSLFAVHISDGLLSNAAVAIGFIVTGVLLIPAVWRVHEDEIPRIALLTAAFFVSSSIHVKVGPTSVHLLMNALVGVILGHRAPLAIVVGLLLQAALLAHGGFLSLGVNAVVIALPALFAGIAFPVLVGRNPTGRRVSLVGFALGWLTVVTTAAMNAAVLIFGGLEDWTVIAAPQFVVYVVLGLVEGIILGVTAGYLVRVRPDLLRITSH